MKRPRPSWVMTIIMLFVFLLMGAFAGWLAGLAQRWDGIGAIGEAAMGAAAGVAAAFVFEWSSVPSVLAFLGVLFVGFVATLLVLSVIGRIRHPTT